MSRVLGLEPQYHSFCSSQASLAFNKFYKKQDVKGPVKSMVQARGLCRSYT